MYIYKYVFLSSSSEKRNIEGYVLNISPLKKAKTLSKENKPREYFDMTFQTEEKKVRAVCFSPDKYPRLKKMCSDGSSCEVSRLSMSQNKMDYVVEPHSVVKPATVNFAINKEYDLTSLDQIVNEIPVYSRVTVKVTVVSMKETIVRNNLTI